jgi:hypothetical protein
MVAWNFIEAITGSSCVSKTDVLSAKAAVVVLSNVGKSLVQIRYRTGSKIFPCGMPASVFFKVVILSLNFR